MSVKNDSANRSPIATGLLLSGLRNDINLSINLSDPENDLLDLMFEYSLDNGNNWQITDNISGEFSGITVPTTHTFIWHSLLDIQLTTDVIVRVTPSDQGMSTASPMNSIIFTLNNSNTLPYTQIPQVSGAKHDLNITFDSIDADLAETLSYNFQYSVDSGNTWINSSNVKNLVSGLPSMNQTFVWNSLADIYDNQSNVQIRVIPQDSVSEGYYSSVEFAINNNNWSRVLVQRLRRGHTSIIFDQKSMYGGGSRSTITHTIDIYDLKGYVDQR